MRHSYLERETVCHPAPRHFEAGHYPKEGKWRCPAPNCLQGREKKEYTTPNNLWWHFSFRHLRDTVRIGVGGLPP